MQFIFHVRFGNLENVCDLSGCQTAILFSYGFPLVTVDHLWSTRAKSISRWKNSFSESSKPFLANTSCYNILYVAYIYTGFFHFFSIVKMHPMLVVLSLIFHFKTWNTSKSARIPQLGGLLRTDQRANQLATPNTGFEESGYKTIYRPRKWH